VVQRTNIYNEGDYIPIQLQVFIATTCHHTGLLSLSPNQFSWRDEEGLAVLTDALTSADERFLGWALFVAHALGLDGGRRGRRL
jgi:hypothetical protein